MLPQNKITIKDEKNLARYFNEESLELTQVIHPDNLVAQRVMASVKAFKSVKKDPKRYELEEQRESMLKNMSFE